MKDNLEKIEGINKVLVNITNHFMAEAINKQVNEGKSGGTAVYDK